MDHDATREQLELAALEPGGLERLMAGDTPAAQAVAAHLAGCPTCTDELARLQRASTLIRAAVREMPSPSLRERTMAAIRAEGVQRPLAVAGAPFAAATGLSTPVPQPAVRRSRVQPALGWVGAVAAAVILSIASTSLIVGGRVDGQLAAQAETISALEDVTTATLAISGQPDAQHVTLAAAASSTVHGTLAFSPSTSELVIVTTGLARPPAGQEYRCWVEIGGQRQRVGMMFFSPDLAYWVGSAPAVAGLSAAATFGVSLVPSAGSSVDTAPVLVGKL
jgi:hypothetical protein